MEKEESSSPMFMLPLHDLVNGKIYHNFEDNLSHATKVVSLLRGQYFSLLCFLIINTSVYSFSWQFPNSCSLTSQRKQMHSPGKWTCGIEEYRVVNTSESWLDHSPSYPLHWGYCQWLNILWNNHSFKCNNFLIASNIKNTKETYFIIFFF